MVVGWYDIDWRRKFCVLLSICIIIYAFYSVCFSRPIDVFIWNALAWALALMIRFLFLLLSSFFFRLLLLQHFAFSSRFCRNTGNVIVYSYRFISRRALSFPLDSINIWLSRFDLLIDLQLYHWHSNKFLSSSSSFSSSFVWLFISSNVETWNQFIGRLNLAWRIAATISHACIRHFVFTLKSLCDPHPSRL